MKEKDLRIYFFLVCEFSNWIEDKVTNTIGIVSLIELKIISFIHL